MDSWESARHNVLGVETLILEIPELRDAEAVFLSTEYHDGNQSPFVRISVSSEIDLSVDADSWRAIKDEFPQQIKNSAGMISMTGHSWRAIHFARSVKSIRSVKIEMIPDGGLSRLMLLSSQPDPRKFLAGEVFSAKDENIRYGHGIPQPRKPMPLGGKSLLLAEVKATNEHYGPARQVISPYPALHMFDGLESARSRDLGHFEVAEIKFYQAKIISRIEFDFQFFVNNNPREISLEVKTESGWHKIKERFFVKPFAGKKWLCPLSEETKVEAIKVFTFPDGGINRIRFS